jgi:hypothetical protein
MHAQSKAAVAQKAEEETVFEGSRATHRDDSTLRFRFAEGPALGHEQPGTVAREHAAHP